MNKQWCESCKQETNQKIDYKDQILKPLEIFSRGTSESAWIIGCTEIIVSTCLGCEEKNLNTLVKQLGPEGIVNKIKENNRCNQVIPKNWVFEIKDEDIFLLFIEIYNAINRDLNRLAIMGIRSLLDFYLNDSIGDIGGFDKKMKEAKKSNILSGEQYEILSSVIEVGHSVVHRKSNLDRDDIIEVLKIVENLFYQSISLGKIKKIESRISVKNKNDREG